MQGRARIPFICLILANVLLAGCNNRVGSYDPRFKVEAPLLVSISENEPDFIRLSWSVDNNVDLYCNVYREPGISSTGREKLGDTNQYQYYDYSELVPETIYTYYIEPVNFCGVPGDMSSGFQGAIGIGNADLHTNFSFDLIDNPDSEVFHYQWFHFTRGTDVNYQLDCVDFRKTNDPFYSTIAFIAYANDRITPFYISPDEGIAGTVPLQITMDSFYLKVIVKQFNDKLKFSFTLAASAGT